MYMDHLILSGVGGNKEGYMLYVTKYNNNYMLGHNDEDQGLNYVNKGRWFIGT